MNAMDISSMLEVQVKEMSVKKNVTPGRATSMASTAIAAITQEENAFYGLLFNDIASVRFHRIHCTACNVHIGSAPAQIHNIFEHPILHTLLCANCREFYGDGTFEQGDDATDMFCRWCANGGNLYCCSYCSNTFCYKCIKRNFSSLIRKKIEADEKWKCFVCNPRDLYSARAMCWALLQHVQTVTRILKNDKKMSAKEIEEKMNLDESQCCVRKNKRKYRRIESNSEEEDETYIPNSNGLSMNMKRKMKKFKSAEHLNCATPTDMKVRLTQSYPKTLIPIQSASSISFQTFKQTELSQSGIEHEKQIVTLRKTDVESSESIVLSSPSVINTDTSLNYSDSDMLQSPSFYHTFVNNAGSSTFVELSSAVEQTIHQITLPSLPSQPASYQLPQLPRLQSQPPLNAMVCIPNLIRKRYIPRLLSESRRSNLTLDPNVIELGSDSDDEPKIVEQQNDSMADTDIRNLFSDEVMPVALTWGNSDDDCVVREEQSLREMSTSIERNTPSFNEVMVPYRQELNNILSGVREKVRLLFNLSNESQDAKFAAQKVTLFYRYMRNTVLQLACVNDRLVREYDGWMKSQNVNTDVSSATDQNVSVIQENVEIPLDMTCVNDSEIDSDCEEPACQIKEPSDLVKSNNVIKDLLFFKKDVTKDCDVNDTAISRADKAIQVREINPCDYEKCIGYSVLNPADYDSKTNDDDDNDNISRPTKAESQSNFGKYEEQFIHYLQHIEDHGIETEDTEELMDHDKIPSQEIRKVTSPFLPLQDINLCTSTDEQTKNSKRERDTVSYVNSSFKKNKIDVPTNTLHKNEISNKSNIDIKIMEKKSQKTKNRPTEKKTISISNNNEASSSRSSKPVLNIQICPVPTENKDRAIIED